MKKKSILNHFKVPIKTIPDYYQSLFNELVGSFDNIDQFAEKALFIWDLKQKGYNLPAEKLINGYFDQLNVTAEQAWSLIDNREQKQTTLFKGLAELGTELASDLMYCLNWHRPKVPGQVAGLRMPQIVTLCLCWDITGERESARSITALKSWLEKNYDQNENWKDDKQEVGIRLVLTLYEQHVNYHNSRFPDSNIIL